MGAGTSAEEFFLKSINVESIFEFIERTDYLFLYSIKECVEKSDCHEGVYLSEVVISAVFDSSSLSCMDTPL